MHSISRRILTHWLVVVYGGASLLGYGLHMLSAHDHHHHGVGPVACDHHHGSHHHDHNHGHAGCSDVCKTADGERHSAEQAFSSTDGDAESHECDICNFLAQARSAAPQVAAEIVWQHVVAVVPAALPVLYQGAILSPHAARGPPAGLV